MFDLIHTPDSLGLIKRPDIEIVKINKICLKGFGHDLSDTQDSLECWRMEFKFM